jgi:hypothetical protein
MVEKETLYNFTIIGVVAICFIAGVYIFLIKPATDKTLTEKNFEEQRNIFLSRYCSNLNFQNFTFTETGSLYNAYCFTESSPMVRVVSYLRYDFSVKDGSYTFWVLQERK